MSTRIHAQPFERTTASFGGARRSSENGQDFAALLGGAAGTNAVSRASGMPAERSGSAESDDAPAAQTPRGLDVARRRHEAHAERQQMQRDTVAARRDARHAAAGESSESGEAPREEDRAAAAAGPRDDDSRAPDRPAASERRDAAQARAAQARPSRRPDEARHDADRDVAAEPLADSPDPASDDETLHAAETAAGNERATPAAAPGVQETLASIREALRLAAAAADPAALAAETSTGEPMPRALRLAAEPLTLPAPAGHDGLLAAAAANARRENAPGFAANLAVNLAAELPGLALGPAKDVGLALGTELAAAGPNAGGQALAAALAPLPNVADVAGASRAAAAAAAAPPMTLPPDHPDFVDALGERIVWITDGGLSNATIEMNPQDLGSLRVQVQLRGTEAQVAFGADNPATRALLASTLPQLRELFAGQGLQLMRSQIETRSSSPTSRGGFGDGDAPQGRGLGETRTRVTRVQIVDAYV